MRWLKRSVLGLVLSFAFLTTSLAAGPDGTSAANAIPLTPSASGTLVGSGAGSFAYYVFPYYGDASTGTIAVDISASDPRAVGAFGVVLYQSGAQLGSMSGFGPKPGANSMPFWSTTAAPVVAQVYNYASGVTVNYTLTVSGVKPPIVVAPTVTPVPAPGSPEMPLAAPRSVSGTLGGNSAGSYVYYSFDCPGDGSLQVVALDLAQLGPDVTRAVTLALFQNGERLAVDDVSHASTPGHLVLSFSSTKAGQVVAQIGNYNMRTTIDYTISH